MAWQAALTPGNVFDPGGVASSWASATQRKTARGYGRFLFWLRERGELDETVDPASRVTPELALAYLQELQRRNAGHTIQNRIQELGDAMRALAPDRDWRWILRAAGRLRADTVPARDKRSRLRPIQELAAAGFGLMAEAETAEGLSDLGRAVAYRDGLLVAFLSFHPMRLRDLASLRLGDHLFDHGGQLLLKLASTKNGRIYEAVIATALAQPLRRYLRHYWPVLSRARGRWHAPVGSALWISKDGSPCSDITLRNIIQKRTGGAGRLPLWPHLFRHCAATSIAVDAPGSIDIIPAVLAHSSHKAGERYYNLAGSLEASRAQSAMLADIQRELGLASHGRCLNRAAQHETSPGSKQR
ncbi:MAG: tyrosine-type recombinase/integrase [Stellaceae bacterium]